MNVSLYKGDDLIFKKKVKVLNDNDCLSFTLDGMNHMVDKNLQTFKRENDEYLFLLDFFNKKCILTLKLENYSLDIPVLKCSFMVNEDEIVLDYFIDTDDCNICFKIDWND